MISLSMIEVIGGITSSCRVGSLGYYAFQEDAKYYRICQPSTLVITKNGKSGRERIHRQRVVCNAFELVPTLSELTDAETARKILEIVSLYPRKFGLDTVVTTIERRADLLKLSPLDFSAVIVGKSASIKDAIGWEPNHDMRIDRNIYGEFEQRGDNGSIDVLAIEIDKFANTDVVALGELITLTSVLSHRFIKKHGKYIDFLYKYFESMDNRKQVVSRLVKLMASTAHAVARRENVLSKCSARLADDLARWAVSTNCDPDKFLDVLKHRQQRTNPPNRPQPVRNSSFARHLREPSYEDVEPYEPSDEDLATITAPDTAVEPSDEGLVVITAPDRASGNVFPGPRFTITGASGSQVDPPVEEPVPAPPRFNVLTFSTHPQRSLVQLATGVCKVPVKLDIRVYTTVSLPALNYFELKNEIYKVLMDRGIPTDRLDFALKLIEAHPPVRRREFGQWAFPFSYELLAISGERPNYTNIFVTQGILSIENTMRADKIAITAKSQAPVPFTTGKVHECIRWAIRDIVPKYQHVENIDTNALTMFSDMHNGALLESASLYGNFLNKKFVWFEASDVNMDNGTPDVAGVLQLTDQSSPYEVFLPSSTLLV